MNYLYAGIAALVFLLCAEQWGEHRVQVEWEKDKAVRQALLDQTIKQNEDTLNAIKSQARKDQAAATSKAGRDAVNRFLREHGLLLTSEGHLQAQGQQGTNGTSDQSGTGDPLEEFAIGCGRDALKVMRWQELCVRMNCEIVD